MQYDSIILELMTRVQALEEQVERLNSRLNEVQNNAVQEFNQRDSVRISNEPDEIPRKKMTKEMIRACYEYGVLYYNDSININDAQACVAEKTGMNRNSSGIYINAVKNMLKGVPYKRSISVAATEKFFEYILSDYGKQGLSKAVRSARANIAYRKQCGFSVTALIKLCEAFEQ